MVSTRKLTFANDQIYHVYNRGVERRPIFLDKRDYQRFLLTIGHYRYMSSPMRLSKLLLLNTKRREDVMQVQSKTAKSYIDLIAYCLMPNHFHLVLRQTSDEGISTFLSNITNSYTKYFNAKNERVGPLFQGVFKAVRVENDEQLLHLSGYIHYNPVAAYLVADADIDSYEWSSYTSYVADDTTFVDPSIVLGQFEDRRDYEAFVVQKETAASSRKRISHLVLEDN